LGLGYFFIVFYFGGDHFNLSCTFSLVLELYIERSRFSFLQKILKHREDLLGGSENGRTKYLKKCDKNIKDQNIENADVEVTNRSPLTKIGKGRQGAVFPFTDDICVKFFGKEEDCDREYYALSLGHVQ